MKMTAEIADRAQRAVAHQVRLTIDPVAILALVARLDAAEELIECARTNASVLLDLELDSDVRGFVTILHDELKADLPAVPTPDDSPTFAMGTRQRR